MTNSKLIDMLIDFAVDFQKDPDWLRRNAHMFQGYSLTEEPDIFQRSAILTCFLNHVGNKLGMDLGMYMSDFEERIKNG